MPDSKTKVPADLHVPLTDQEEADLRADMADAIASAREVFKARREDAKERAESK